MRRAIAGRRGSVRGAPPQTYVPFGDFHDDDEHWRPALRLVKAWFIGLAIIAVAGFILAIFYAIGLNPSDE